MFKPSSETPRETQGDSAAERANPQDARPDTCNEEMSAEERRARIASALEHVNRKFGNALRKLAE